MLKQVYLDEFVGLEFIMVYAPMLFSGKYLTRNPAAAWLKMLSRVLQFDQRSMETCSIIFDFHHSIEGTTKVVELEL